MPAQSASQQRLFGMVHAYQKGELKNPPDKVRNVAKHISKQDARDFAATSTRNLPDRKKEAREKVAVALVRYASVNGSNELLPVRRKLVKVARSVLQGTPLIPAFREQFPRLGPLQIAKLSQHIVKKVANSTCAGSGQKTAPAAAPSQSFTGPLVAGNTFLGKQAGRLR